MTEHNKGDRANTARVTKASSACITTRRVQVRGGRLGPSGETPDGVRGLDVCCGTVPWLGSVSAEGDDTSNPQGSPQAMSIVQLASQADS